MNRLIIVGNGFDLAHGLPTSYRNFIDDFWINFKENYLAEEYQKMIYCNENFNGYFHYGQINNYEGFLLNIEDFAFDNKYDFDQKSTTCSAYLNGQDVLIFKFNNRFFKLINDKNSQNWVDIENEYYKQLIICLKKSDNTEIIKLNAEFEDVKKLLENYLIEKVQNTYSFSEYEVEAFMDIFKSQEYSGSTLDRFFNEISTKTKNEMRNEYQKILGDHLRDNGFSTKIERPKHEVKLKNYFLSFNYTPTVTNYAKELGLKSEQIIEIHGKLEDEKNAINFGFGDEMDRQYQEIEEKDDNEYLKNIKSFQYLHSSNYKRLLDLIDSEQFQVYIMGHSCGLSDRTLLNTIFEHENCCSIKVFYHQRSDGSDNYTEITQNISRHFNKKKLMREKVVNKTLCQPLPQVQLPIK